MLQRWNRAPVRSFSTTLRRLSQVDPSDPDQALLYKIKRPGTFFKEPLDPQIQLSHEPLYTAPMASQVSFTKRWSLGFFGVGAYIGYLTMGVGASSTLVAAGLVPLLLPLPLIQYFAGGYVTRIFRVYRRNEPQTYEALTENETLMVEKLSLFGRSTYGVPIQVQNTFIANRRLGWINWVHLDERTGALTKLYVEDNIGGIQMDRIWGILEKNSNIDNGRSFLNDRPKGA